MISADSFKVYLTGGATWDMMIDTDYSKNKTLLPDFGLGLYRKHLIESYLLVNLKIHER